MPCTAPVDETVALLKLLRLEPGNGVRLSARLYAAASARGALGADARRVAAAQIEADLAWLDAPQRRLLSILDSDYPPQLKASAQAPAMLFVEGDPLVLWQPQVAIVGARRATAGGIANARMFAYALACSGLAITSGLAEGIDSAAHQAALDAQRPTIAVCGTGLATVFPRRHVELARRIASTGALVSAFPPHTPPRASHFPRRNRIIAGLSLGTLVIEASIRSGSLITARLAAEQGREVFAIPGSIHSPLARGCHRLIREGAHLVEGTAELLAELAPLAHAQGHAISAQLDAAAAPSGSVQPIDATARTVLRALGHDPLDVDQLIERSALHPSQVAAALTVLEIEGQIERLHGGQFQALGGPARRTVARASAGS